MYDARAYYDATKPPTFIAPNGKKYIGRVLSVPEWAPYREMLTQASKGEGESLWNSVHTSMMTLVDAMFPHPWWKPWEPKVSTWLLTLPPIERMKAVWDFMRSQGQAYGKEWGTGPFPGTKPTTDQTPPAEKKAEGQAQAAPQTVGSTSAST